MATPARATPPMVGSLSRRSSRRLSEEERGSTSERRSWESEDSTPATPIQSPLPAKRLFHDNGPRRPWLGRKALVRCQLCIVVLLAAMALVAWLPVLLWTLGRIGEPEVQSVDSLRRSEVVSDEEAEERPHAHAFHEQGCAGESIVVRHQSDLCLRRFPSGAPVKDNVASVLLAGGGSTRLGLRVYATCREREQPADPMLLEVVGERGCVDLKYPLAGTIEVVELPPTSESASLEL